MNLQRLNIKSPSTVRNCQPRRTLPCLCKWFLLVVAWTIIISCGSISFFLSSPLDLLSPAPIPLPPIQHVYYLKTHKTGSTTIYSVLAEYCRAHDLRPLLPLHIHINLRPPFYPRQVLLDNYTRHYDMVFNHHVYSPRIFDHLHNDTFKFTTLREPFNHFVSSFNYFRETENFAYLRQIITPDPMATFLSDPLKYEAKGYTSFTNNRQSMDLGYNISYSFHDLSYIRSFIDDVQRRFDLVLITDYFHESLILLKRALRWSTEDILYYRKLSATKRVNISEDLLLLYRKQHENFSRADVELYQHFLQLFKQTLYKEKDVQGEAKEFEVVLAKVHQYCDKEGSPEDHLIVEKGRWSDLVRLPRAKCKWLKLDEVSFTKHLKSVRRLLLEARASDHQRLNASSRTLKTN